MAKNGDCSNVQDGSSSQDLKDLLAQSKEQSAPGDFTGLAESPGASSQGDSPSAQPTQ